MQLVEEAVFLFLDAVISQNINGVGSFFGKIGNHPWQVLRHYLVFLTRTVLLIVWKSNRLLPELFYALSKFLSRSYPDSFKDRIMKTADISLLKGVIFENKNDWEGTLHCL